MNTIIQSTASLRHTSLPASMLKGAAVNTVIQALGGNLKKETFFKTMLVGALGGVVENLAGNMVLPGIVLGGGNALINKSSVPRTMFKYAAWSLAAQGVKSIGEAKAAELFDDRKWKIRLEYRLPGGNLKFFHQSDPSFGCTQETLKSIADYLCVPLFFLDYPIDLDSKDTNYLDYKSGADFQQLAQINGLYVETLPKNDGNGYNSPDYVGNYLHKDYPVAITYERPNDLPHTVAINRILRLQNIVNPKRKDRYVIEVMDPMLTNSFATLPMDVFKSGVVRIVKSQLYA